jgi:Poly(hydroxyalcanoate) granule associated protein (phasin)
MQKQATFGIRSNPITEAAINASRQMWLAGLGAAAVTRDWARIEAGKTFRTLVKEGSAVETKAIRDVSKRVELSVATATSLWKQTRATTVTAANAIAKNASVALSKFKAPVVARSAPKKARKVVKATKKRAKRATRRVKRASRKA